MAVLKALLLAACAATAVLAENNSTPPGFDSAESGFINVPGFNDVNLFYWLTKSRGDPLKDPLVMWLTGGPGCSSELALLAENGPFSVAPNPRSKADVIKNVYGWNAKADLLYVDQPVGTGFSYTSDQSEYVKTEEEVAAQLYGFLQAFFQLYPSLVGRPFFITGESYAGHYVPAIGWKVVSENQKSLNPHINLQGLAIGNGLVEPLIQYGAYGDYLKNQNPPLVDDVTYNQVAAFYTSTCAPAIEKCQADAKAAVAEYTRLRHAGANPEPLRDPASCVSALNTCQGRIVNALLDAASDIQGFDVNVYDIRKPCNGPLCYDFTAEETFMNLPDVQASLGVPAGTYWTECDNLVHSYLTQDWMTNLEKNIPAMLAAGVRVLVYAGDKDFICNFEGNKRWVNSMKWAGAADFAAAPTLGWTLAGEPAGLAKSANGLTLLQVYDAGHMVPMDKPAAALDMLQRLMDNKPFSE